MNMEKTRVSMGFLEKAEIFAEALPTLLTR
jgi:hypothetical protein